MDSNIHTRLLGHMNRQPFLLPHPVLESGIEILKELFTEEEASLLLNMTAIPDTPENVAERAGKQKHDVAAMLEDMGKRGLVFATGDEHLKLYGMFPFLPGLYEFQFARQSDARRPNSQKLAGLFKRYYYEGLGKYAAMLYAESDIDTVKARVITVEQQVPDVSGALPYERATKIVKNQAHIALIACYCRSAASVRGEPCKLHAPLDVCLLLGPVAEYAIAYGHGRRLTVDEAIDALKRSEAAGLIHTASNCKEPMVICNCCSCCCGTIKGLSYFDPPGKVVKSRFKPSIASQECTSCGECVESCQLHALEIVEDSARVNESRCIGCGQCSLICPANAIRLVEREDFDGVNHDTYLDLSMHVARSRKLI